MTTSAGHTPRQTFFVAGEPQREALARIDYVQTRVGGWCELSGPQGIGKTTLLMELSRRAHQRGDQRAWLDLSPLTSFDWFGLLADAWHIELPPGSSTLEARRRFEDHFAGWRAMNRTAWMFVDHADGFTEDLSRGCRWLCQVARRMEFPLMLIVARRADANADALCDDADLHLELWPWGPADCERYVEACSVRRGSPDPVAPLTEGLLIDEPSTSIMPSKRRPSIGTIGRVGRPAPNGPAPARSVSFSPGAIGALCERTAGLPRDVAKLFEWSLAAAEAESLVDIEPELIHAIAEEFSPHASYRQAYETSAAYGAW